MPRLLHIMDYEPRGTRTFDHFIIGLSRELNAKGWDVRFAFGAEPPVAFQQALAAEGAGYVVIPFPFTRASARELLHRLGDFRPDVTQTSFLSSFCWPLLKLKLTGRLGRLVVIDHSSGQAPVRRGLSRMVARFRGWAVGKIVDAIIPVSRAIAKRDVERVFLPAHKVRVVYNGLLLDRFPNAQRPPREILRVVYAGQLIPEKGVMTLLEAHAALRTAGSTGYELLVAGQGAQEHELREYCRTAALNDVQFLGHVDAIPELFGTADIVVIPSNWFEAFGLVLIEAMACGACCLVSDAGALPEVIDGAGSVFRSGDAGDLAAKLKELLEDKVGRKRMAEVGRARVESLFTLAIMIDQHLAVCEEVQQRRFGGA